MHTTHLSLSGYHTGTTEANRTEVEKRVSIKFAKKEELKSDFKVS